MNRITPEMKPLWGKFTAPQMLAHCNDWMRMIRGELPTAPRPSKLNRWPIKQLAIYWMPWPKGVPTAKELLDRPPDNWPAERDELCRSLEEIESVGANGKFPEHPAFGNMSRSAWGVLGYRHTDHHLRQFGV